MFKRSQYKVCLIKFITIGTIPQKRTFLNENNFEQKLSSNCWFKPGVTELLWITKFSSGLEL